MRNAMMQALVYLEPGKIELRRVPIPALEPGDILLKVRYAGVCGTDIRIYHGTKKIPAPRIIGHEFAGEIAEVSGGNTQFDEGNRVTVYPVMFCEQCYACRGGRRNICVDRKTLGYEYDGGFAEYVRVPASAVASGNVLKIPSNVTDMEAAISEPIAAAHHGVEVAGIKPGERVVIVGAGPIGLCHVQLVKAAGAATIIIVEPIVERREMALRFGAAFVIDPQEQEPVKAVMGLTNGEGADVVLLDVGVPAVLESSLHFLKKGGRYVIFAGCPNDSRVTIDPNVIHYRELVLVGSSASTPENQHRILEMLSQRSLTAEEIISDALPLKDWKRAFEMKEEWKGLKMLLQP